MGISSDKNKKCGSDNYIISKMNYIFSLIQKAESEYTSNKVIKKSIPSDYKILFILFRSVTLSGNTFLVEEGSNKEKIFYEAVNNFKYSIENFTNKNVHIIPTIKIVNQNVESTESKYLQSSNISSILADLAPAGLYDAVITSSGAEWGAGGVTSTGMLSNNIINNYSFYGYSGCSINTDNDIKNIGKGYDKNNPYLVTTNIFIHEWMHQLENLRNILKPNGENIIYPYTHAYYEDYQKNPTKDWMYKDKYKWDENYFNDEKKYPHVVERRLTSFYRAVLACEVEYIPNNHKKVGMYPEFWKLTPNTIVLGKFILQDSNSLYMYSRFSSYSTYKSEELSNEIGYYWDVFYDIMETNKILKKKSCIKRNYDSELFLRSTTFTRIGNYEEGEYSIVNKTLGKVLAFSVSDNKLIPKVEDYKNNEFEIFKLSHYSNCFFKVSPAHNLVKFLDLCNIWDTEDNSVSFHIWTGYTSAQAWQFCFTKEECHIMPLASTTRYLSYHDNTLHIVSKSNSNFQNWRLEKINNGKFIFDGKYKIQDSSTGQYLYATENELILATTGTDWIINNAGNFYYMISTEIETEIKYISVLNACDREEQTVQVHIKTNFEGAEKWKFILNLDGTIKILPKLSIERGLKCTAITSSLSKNCGAFLLIKTQDT